MRAVVQRVLRASVEVDNRIVSEIGEGLLVFAGFNRDDDRSGMEYIASKIFGLRIFNDAEGLMNRSVLDVKGELLVVSQFTLYGDARKGRRPSYSSAMPPDDALKKYNEFIEFCINKFGPVKSGIFGADMKVNLINSGPVTILLDSGKLF